MLLISKSNRLYMALAVTRDTVIYLLPETLFWVWFLQESVRDFLTPILPAHMLLYRTGVAYGSAHSHSSFAGPFLFSDDTCSPSDYISFLGYSYHLHMDSSQTSISCYNTRMVFVMTYCTFTTRCLLSLSNLGNVEIFTTPLFLHHH